VTRKDSHKTCKFTSSFFNYFHFPIFYKGSSAGNLHFPIGKSAGNARDLRPMTPLLRLVTPLLRLVIPANQLLAFRVRVGIVCLAVVTDFAHFKNALFDLILQKLTRRSFWHVGFFNEVAGDEFVAL
jgi:hypothetical protein